MDCYNANPDSMKKSINSFLKEFDHRDASLYLVLGEMGELGRFSQQFHKDIVDYILEFPEVEKVFMVGNDFFNLKIENSKLFFSKSIDDVVNVLPEEGIFLLKGSRSNKLENILKLLER